MTNQPLRALFSCVAFLVIASVLSTPSFAAPGCVFPEDVRREYRRVNKDDGITKKEAGLIAQMEFLNKDVDNFFLKLLNDVKLKDDNTWLVTFQAYHDGPESGKAIDVCVDKLTGEITCWNKRPLVIKQKKLMQFGSFAVHSTSGE